MGRPTHYRAAIWLSVLSGALALVLIAFVFRRSGRDGIVFWAMLLVIPFGLWVASSFVRYVGGVLLVITAASVLWPILESPGLVLQRLPLSTLFMVLAAANLSAAWLLFFSKQFRIEFAEEQKLQPRYKIYIRRSLHYALVGAAVIATANDIINLAASR